MEKYKTCVHSKYDKIWGEYKCLENARRIHGPEECENCPVYKKDATKKEGVEEDGDEEVLY